MIGKQTALWICIRRTIRSFFPQAYGQDFQGTEERKRNYSQEGMHATIFDLGIYSWTLHHFLAAQLINWYSCTIYAGHSGAANCITMEQYDVHDVLRSGS